MSTSLAVTADTNPWSLSSFWFECLALGLSHLLIHDEISEYNNDNGQVFIDSKLALKFTGGQLEDRKSIVSDPSISDQYICIQPRSIQIRVHLCNFCMRDTANILDADPFSPWTFSCIGNRPLFLSFFSPFEKFSSPQEHQMNRFDPVNPTTWGLTPGFAYLSSSGRLLFFRSFLHGFFLWCCFFCHFLTSFNFQCFSESTDLKSY